MKRTVALFLALATCFLFSFSTGALQILPAEPEISNEKLRAIVQEVQVIEAWKKQMGLDAVDFEQLSIGNSISVYEYSDTGFIEMNLTYPIFYNNELVMLAHEINDSTYQIMTGLANLVNQTKCTRLAIIYDRAGVFIFNGKSFVHLANDSTETLNRKYIDSVQSDELGNIRLTNLAVRKSIDYDSCSPNVNGQANFILSVPYVTQLPYDKICWAATVAMIANYVMGYNLTADEVAMAWLDGVINQGQTTAQAINCMNTLYRTGYTASLTAPDDDRMLINIRDYKKPLYGSFRFIDSTAQHAVVICGINTIAGRVMIVDPEYGEITCYYETNSSWNGYTYTSPTSNKKLRLLQGGWYA